MEQETWKTLRMTVIGIVIFFLRSNEIFLNWSDNCLQLDVDTNIMLIRFYSLIEFVADFSLQSMTFLQRLHVFVCIRNVCTFEFRIQNRAMDFLQLALQAVVSHPTCWKPKVITVACALEPWATCTIPNFFTYLFCGDESSYGSELRFLCWIKSVSHYHKILTTRATIKYTYT